jgi:hypothetical protein
MYICYSHTKLPPTKNNEILSFASKWMEFENIILSEASQKSHVLPHMWITDLK